MPSRSRNCFFLEHDVENFQRTGFSTTLKSQTLALINALFDMYFFVDLSRNCGEIYQGRDCSCGKKILFLLCKIWAPTTKSLRREVALYGKLLLLLIRRLTGIKRFAV